MLEFYHCTSDIFLESIKKTGLGKINPNFDLNLLELLEYVFKIGNENLPENDGFKKLAYTTQLMINQEITKVDKEIYSGDEELNFTHDGLFITLGDRAAITHMHYNPYGSEILNRIMQLLGVLIHNNIEFSIPESIDKMDVLNLMSRIPKPLFIKINNIDYNCLLNKYNIPLGTLVMDNIENTLQSSSPNVQFRYRQESVFKYLSHIEKDDFEIYYLEYDGLPTDYDFEYYLTLIK